MSNELALANAIASVEMEGLYLSDDGYELCRRYSNREITWNEFLEKALLCYGISEDELKKAYVSKFEKNMKRW